MHSAANMASGVEANTLAEGDAVTKCKDYQEQRRKAKVKRLYGVMTIASVLTVIACFLIVLKDRLHWSFYALANLVLTASICACASLPTSDVNVNRIFKQRWYVRVIFGALLILLAYRQAEGSIILFTLYAMLPLWLAMNHRDEEVILELPRSVLGDLCRWPDTTTLACVQIMAAYSISSARKLVSYAQLGPEAFPVVLVALFFPCSMVWLATRTRYRQSGGERGADPTLRFWLTLFVMYGQRGLVSLSGIFFGVIDQQMFELIFLGAPFVLFAVGRDRLFGFCARHFENSQASSDGAMMAEILGSRRELCPGMTRWVHRPAPNEAFDYFDPKRNWQQGVIIQITCNDLAVELADGQVERMPYSRIAVSAGDLMEIAVRDFRGIPWKNFSRELMESQTSEGNASPEDLTIPILSTRPDYFLSHSWHDNASDKYDELTKFSEEFRAKHGREPVFWLDKVCINQERIADGLRVLPINVMTCKKILSICGDTYLSRLWCVMELCTLLSFMNEAEAAARVELRLLPGSSKSEDEVLDDIMNFDVRQARCYDPNEQEHLMDVISALGFDHMNAKMRRLGAALKKKSGAAGSFSKAGMLQAIARRSEVKASPPEIDMPEATVIGVARCEEDRQDVALKAPCIWI